MTTWKLDSLRNKFNGNDSAKELISSITNSIDIFRYHFITARDENLKINEDDPVAGFELVIPPDERAADIELMKIAIQANIQACMHASRPLYDFFGQLVNELVLTEKFQLHECTIYKVTERLPNSELKKCLIKLIQSDSFRYMNGFINTIKHRSLIRYGARVDLENGHIGVQFKSFKFNKVTYNPMWAKEVLELVLDVKNGIVTAGIALNSHLGVENA